MASVEAALRERRYFSDRQASARAFDRITESRGH